MLDYCSVLVTTLAGRSSIAYNEMEILARKRGYFGYTSREWE